MTCFKSYVLHRELRGSVTHEIHRHIHFRPCTGLCFTHIEAQETGTIYGTVVDRQNGDPLMGATVFLEGTNWGTLCDLDGSFRLMDIQVEKYVLIASMIGYQKVSITGVEVSRWRAS